MKDWPDRRPINELKSLLTARGRLPCELKKATNANRLVAFFISEAERISSTHGAQPVQADRRGDGCILMEVGVITGTARKSEFDSVRTADDAFEQRELEVVHLTPCLTSDLPVGGAIERVCSPQRRLTLIGRQPGEREIALKLAIRLGNVFLTLRTISKDIWIAFRAMRYASGSGFARDFGGGISNRSCPLPNQLSRRLVMT